MAIWARNRKRAGGVRRFPGADESDRGAELITLLKGLIAFEHLLKRFEHRRMDVLVLRAVTIEQSMDADCLRDAQKLDTA